MYIAFSDETRYGFGSLLYIRCDCGVINCVPTNKRSRKDDAPRAKPTFSINDKAALGKKLRSRYFLQDITPPFGYNPLEL